MDGFEKFQENKVNKGQIWNTLSIFFWNTLRITVTFFFRKNYLIDPIISSIFWRLILHFKNLVNEEQILNF